MPLKIKLKRFTILQNPSTSDLESGEVVLIHQKKINYVNLVEQL